MVANALAVLLRYDRSRVAGGLLAVTAAAWTYLLLGAGVPMQMMGMG